MSTDARKEVQDLYLRYLEEEGYRPKLDPDGDVAFRCEGGNYFVQVDEGDAQYFRLVYPMFWKIESEEERLLVLATADAVNREKKVAKIFAVKDDTWASFEVLLRERADFSAIFGRAIRILQESVRSFCDRMKSPNERPSGPTH